MEYFAFFSGLLYLFLEIKQNRLMWIVGVLSAIAFIYVFAQSRLFAAMGLQVYYLAVSVYGFYKWKKDEREAESGTKASTGLKAETEAPLLYRIVTWKVLVLSAIATLSVFAALLTFLKNMTGDPMPATDALATSLSIVATLWLSRSYIHQWWIWIAVDAMSTLLFLSQGLYLSSLLYVIYTVCAFYGYFHWRSKGERIE